MVSYDIVTDKGYITARHRRYLRPLHPEHDPKLQNTDNTNDAIKTDDYIREETKIADLPMEEQEVAVSGEQEQSAYTPRRSSRRPVGERRAAKTVKTMGTIESKCHNALDIIDSCNCETGGIRRINIECSVCSGDGTEAHGEERHAQLAGLDAPTPLADPQVHTLATQQGMHAQ